MMQRIAMAAVMHENGMPIIHGSGESNGFISSYVSNYLRIEQETHIREKAMLEAQLVTVKASRDKLRYERKRQFLPPVHRSPVCHALHTVADRLIDAWCILWYVNHTLGQQLIAFGERHGLWKWEP